MKKKPKLTLVKLQKKICCEVMKKMKKSEKKNFEFSLYLPLI